MWEFISDWWTLGLLIAWGVVAYAIALRDNWWLIKTYRDED